MFPRRTLAPGALLILALAAGKASADMLDTFNVTLGGTLMHDDNLFRLPANADPNLVLGKPQKSEDIAVTTLGLKLGKNYSLQRFEFDGTLVDYRYRTFDYLSFTARNYAAAWRWSLTPRFHGNLTKSRTEALNSFADYTGYQNRNKRTTDTSRFDGVFELGPWHLIGAVAQSKSTNEKIFLAEGDSKVDTVEGGLRHVFRSGSSLSYVHRIGKGDYFNRPQPIPVGLYDNGFEQTTDEIQMLWAITPKASLDGRIGRLETHHNHYAQRDYNGTTGNLAFNWEITAKTKINATLAREISSYQTFYSNYTSTDRVTLAPYWQMTAHTGLRLRYDYAKRDFLAPIISTAFDGRSDTQRLGSISLEWQPMTSVLISASLQSDKRSSNKPGLDYDSTMGSVTAQFTF